MAVSDQKLREFLEILLPPDTRRLRFRPVGENDHAAVRAIYGDPQALRFHPRMDEAKKIQSFIDRQLSRYLEFGYGIWLIEALRDGRLVGDAGLTWQETDLGEVLEIGYGLVARERGHGFATEAALACRDFGFDVLGAGQLASLVHKDNTPSIAVAARVHRHQRHFVHPRLEDEYLLFYTHAIEDEIGT